ncbi:hypothetical protein ACQP2F_08025 [Actinoplanes sp. CA-030573]|uniref:hypothetical protein n=1 Tax=Actinoplanes sp. CA-030573 TaxID=3239898 RepID=UPI003D8D67AD
MTGRPRKPRGGGGGGDDGGKPPAHHTGGPPDPDDFGSIRRGEDAVERKILANRPTPTPSGRPRPSGGDRTTTAPPDHSDDVVLRNAMRKYEQLGDKPPRIRLEANDALFNSEGAHTLDRHSPDIPLRRAPGEKTVEGRIYGDEGWHAPANWALKWTDHTTMHHEVNDYVQRNWATIRSDLAMEGQHVGAFEAGHRVGEGFYNDGMFGMGPVHARYTAASAVKIVIELDEGVDPPQPFIVTAYPLGVLPRGLM